MTSEKPTKQKGVAGVKQDITQTKWLEVSLLSKLSDLETESNSTGYQLVVAKHCNFNCLSHFVLSNNQPIEGINFAGTC